MGKFIFRAILHPAEEGGYWVDVPVLDGCFTEGDSFREAVEMAADAMKTHVAALMKYGDPIPEYEMSEVPKGCLFSDVFFETDESYIVEGPVISAAQAARDLGVSPSRVTHMLDAGLLDGYRSGRRTYITVESVERRKASSHAAGRPRKKAVQA